MIKHLRYIFKQKISLNRAIYWLFIPQMITEKDFIQSEK